MHGAGITELSYDSNAINLVIDTQSAGAKEALKHEIAKHFKQAQMSDHETQLEVRLK